MINFSNGQVLQLDEFLDFYKTVDISAENYDSEKSIGLYTGMVIPTECTMLKFRYYTPDGTLIEQENVPLVYDGNSVDHIITKYLLTNKSSGVDYDTEGWTEELQTPSKDVRFVYTYEISVYTNGAEIKTNIVLTSVYGEQGERGSIYLGCYAKNSDVISAYTARGIVSDDYYLNKTNGKIYVCSRNGDLITWTPVAYGDSAAVNKMYSNAVNDALGSGLEGATDIVQALTVWTKNLVASSAFINELVTSKLFSNEITLKTGGVIKSENYNEDSIKEDEQGNKYIDTENYSDTGWAFDSKGTADLVNVHATGGIFDGINATGGVFDNIEVSGKFDSKGGYRYNNRIVWDSGSGFNGDFTKLFEKLKDAFPDYANGNIVCNGRFNFRRGTTLYRIIFSTISFKDNNVGQLTFFSDETMGGVIDGVLYISSFTIFKKISDSTYTYYFYIGNTSFYKTPKSSSNPVEEISVDIYY